MFFFTVRCILIHLWYVCVERLLFLVLLLPVLCQKTSQQGKAKGLLGLQFPALSIQSKIWCFYWSSTIVFCLSMPYYRFFGCDFFYKNYGPFLWITRTKTIMAFWWQFSSFSVPHVRIQGAPDLHVDQGSVINLTCIISYSPEPPVYVFWYRGDKVESTLAICNTRGNLMFILKVM